MKKKIIYIILILIFIGILASVNIFLKQQNPTTETEKKENSASNQTEKNVTEITKEEDFEKEVLKSQETVLIDFYAEWCDPCKRLSPIVEQVAKENAEIKVVKINVDELQEVAAEYNIMSIPTLVVIRDGEEVNRGIGLISKSKIIDLLK